MTAGRLLTDEMYPPVLATRLGERGYDVCSVSGNPELMGLADSEVLARARSNQRCLVTENVRDFAILARDHPHAGLLFVNGPRWPRTRNGMPRIADALAKQVEAGTVPGPGVIGWLA